MTFQEFTASRRWCGNLGEYLRYESLMGMAGYIYADWYFIARTVAFVDYWTIAERDEYRGNLAACERWLWDNFAEAELTAQGV